MAATNPYKDDNGDWKEQFRTAVVDEHVDSGVTVRALAGRKNYPAKSTIQEWIRKRKQPLSEGKPAKASKSKPVTTSRPPLTIISNDAPIAVETNPSTVDERFDAQLGEAFAELATTLRENLAHCRHPDLALRRVGETALAVQVYAEELYKLVDWRRGLLAPPEAPGALEAGSRPDEGNGS